MSEGLKNDKDSFGKEISLLEGVVVLKGPSCVVVVVVVESQQAFTWPCGTSWGGAQPGCWEEHHPGQWSLH